MSESGQNLFQPIEALQQVLLAEDCFEVLPDSCGQEKDPCFATLDRGLDASMLPGEQKRICYASYFKILIDLTNLIDKCL